MKIAEGNANAVYQTKTGIGLRVPKNHADVTEVAKYWNDFWRPKLGEFMGPMEPVVDKFYGPCCLINIHGSRNSEIVAEFKPKWLNQSRSAPIGALSCRTCAINRMRNKKTSFCSLDLGNKDFQALIEHLVPPKHQLKCYELLQQATLIDRLKYWQEVLDQAETIGDCMSLRDCTVLIEHEKGEYRLWIVDLDPKNNIEKWERLEIELQPYYMMPTRGCRLTRLR